MKKKLISFILSVVMIFGLTACGQTEDNTDAQADQSTSADDGSTQTDHPAADSAGDDPAAGGAAGDSDVMIAYFSWSGNTADMAEYIQEQTGGDLFEIQPVEPYPEDYNECGDVALAERDSNARPEIQNPPESLEGYDTLFIGYPIWWHTAPMIIGTFLESYDLSGVDVYPFTQSASMDTEQFDNSMEFVRQSAGNAEVHDGLFADESDTEGIRTYLNENGFGE